MQPCKLHSCIWRGDSHGISTYFLWKIIKRKFKRSPAAALIGALRVKYYKSITMKISCGLQRYIYGKNIVLIHPTPAYQRRWQLMFHYYIGTPSDHLFNSFIPSEQCLYFCKRCRSGWDGSQRAFSSGSTLFVILLLIFDWNPYLQQWMRPNLDTGESVS